MGRNSPTCKSLDSAYEVFGLIEFRSLLDIAKVKHVYSCCNKELIEISVTGEIFQGKKK
jgi:hypothetical protein